MKEIIRLLVMDASDIFRYAAEQLRGLGTIHTDNENYLYLETPHPMALMAHVDTVTILKCTPVEQGSIIRNEEKCPLGADDRAGVFAALEAVRRLKYTGGDIPQIILTNFEEIGGKGAHKMIEAKCLNTEHLRLILALDRKGANDFVYYTPQPKEVKAYVESFGFVEANGSYNDVADFNRAYRIPGVNLSVGYYRQHTPDERLHMDELYLTVARLCRMCKAPIDQLYALTEPTRDRRVVGLVGAGHVGGTRPAGFAFPHAGIHEGDCFGLPHGMEGDIEEVEEESALEFFGEAGALLFHAHPELNLPDWATASDATDSLVDIEDFIIYHTNRNEGCTDCLEDYADCDCGRMADLVYDELAPIDWKIMFYVGLVTPESALGQSILDMIDRWENKKVVPRYTTLKRAAKDAKEKATTANG